LRTTGAGKNRGPPGRHLDHLVDRELEAVSGFAVMRTDPEQPHPGDRYGFARPARAPATT